MTLTRLSLLATLLVAIACAGPGTVRAPAQASPPSVQQEVEATPSGDWYAAPDQDSLRFKASQGARAYLVPVRSKSQPDLRDHYFFQITGSGSASDGLVLLVRREVGSGDSAYIALVPGGARAILRYQRALPAIKRAETWSASSYGDVGPLGKLTVVDQPVDVAAIVALRAQQLALPISEIETIDAEAGRVWMKKRVSDTALSVSENCMPVSMTIDWSTVQEQWLTGSRLGERCAHALVDLSLLCDLHPNLIAKRARPLEVRCAFGADYNQDSDEPLTKLGARQYKYTPGARDNNASRPILQFWRDEFGEDTQLFRSSELHVAVKYVDGEALLFHSRGGPFHPVVGSFSPTMQRMDFEEGAVKGHVIARDGKWMLGCGKQKQDLEEITGAARKDFLQGASFEAQPLWKRAPYFLARDSKGTYYYVDKFRDKFGGGRYRVFIGRKGALKLSKLERLVEDSRGTLFSTAHGDLRLIVSSRSKEGRWIRGKKRTELTSVSVFDNERLIYDELGVYFGETLGFLCQ